MKKTLIALAVLGTIAGVAQAQSSVTIYGIVDTGATYINKVETGPGTTGSLLLADPGILQGSRLGFKGVEDLGGGLKALFQLETGFIASNGALDFQSAGGTGLFNRKSVVGLGGDFGSVLLGRQTDALFDYGRWTAVQDFGMMLVGVGHALDGQLGVRTNNSIRYDTANLSGFTANAIYGFGGTAGQSSAGQSFGLGGQYANGPLALFAAYYQAKLGTYANGSTAPIPGGGVASSASDSILSLTVPIQPPQFGGNPGDTALKTFSIGASYQAGPARLYGNWSRIKQPLAGLNGNGLGENSQDFIGGLSNSKSDIFELGTDYALTGPLHLLASVEYDKLTFVDTATPGKLTQFNLGLDYFLSKRTDVYAFASYQRAQDAISLGTFVTNSPLNAPSGETNQATVAVGIRHKF